MKTLSLLSLLTGATLTAGAGALPSVGPDYVRPTLETPATYQDAGDAIAWKAAAPADATPLGEWWTVFGDAALDGLVRRALEANQDLRAAAARVEQAAAAAGQARSAYWPQIGVAPAFTREQTSTTLANVQPSPLSSTYRAPLTATWELDLFGRVRRLSESARADAESTAATFASVRLALTAEVASNYFTLRALDREQAILRDTVELRRKAQDLVRARYKVGAANELDTVRAETELASTEAEAAAVAGRRAAVKNALAVLLGQPASSFAWATPAQLDAVLPVVPAGLPADLLERRPDVAAAERALAAANARIGVAKAAFFPAISLTGSAGYASAETDQLFKADSRVWSIGPSLYLPLFQGGRNRANLERNRAAYDESVALYRQRVLVALREVQDALTTGRLLTEQDSAQARALAGAKRAAELALIRYEAGYVTYIDVIDTQRTALVAERVSAQLTAQRFNTSVALIKALGGGWHVAPTT